MFSLRGVNLDHLVHIQGKRESGLRPLFFRISSWGVTPIVWAVGDVHLFWGRFLVGTEFWVDFLLGLSGSRFWELNFYEVIFL